MNSEISVSPTPGGVGAIALGPLGNAGPTTTVKESTGVTLRPQGDVKPIPEPTPKASTITFDGSKSLENLKSAIKLLNEQMVSTSRGLGFSYDDSKNSPVIKVMNLESGEVIRQIPSEDLLTLAHKIDDLKGILYNKLT